ncbi:MAG: Gfo/Idh/MocA family oxidoreductase [Thioalkalivibrio sp.]|nr:Gfo/Idh/MocA family oxidoreductase [Thioalkalivibrio sp.]
MSARTAPIRTGIIGFGLAGRVFHAPLISSNADYSLDVIVTSDADRVQAARRSYPRARIVGDFQSVRTSELDLVIVASPPATHVELGMEALERGLAAVIDKPFSVTEAEGLALISQANRVGRPVTVFHNRRWDADYLTLRELLASGALAGVHRFESRFETWKPTTSKVWKAHATPTQGGGVLYDLGSHLIDQALQLFGPVQDIYSELTTCRPGGVAPDDAFVSFLHESGLRTHLWMSTVAAQKGARFRVLGAQSAYTKWHLDGQEAALAAGVLPTDEDYGVEPVASWGRLGVDSAAKPVPSQRGQYDRFYAVLSESLNRGGPLPVDPRDAVNVSAIIEQIHAQHPA